MINNSIENETNTNIMNNPIIQQSDLYIDNQNDIKI